MSTLFYFLQLLLWVFLAIQVAYFLFFSLAGLLPYRPRLRPVRQAPRWLILLPAYREDRVILGAAAAAVAQNYPRNRFQVTVIADGCKPETVEKLRAGGAEVHEVVFEQSTKARALLSALNAEKDQGFDAVLILDADNHIRPDFLKKAEEAWCAGHDVIQAHRTAKNKQTPMAFLDHLNEEIGNHIFRKGHRTVGLSSALIGSGMVLPFDYLHRQLQGAEHLAGEDKELEFRILAERKTIEYLPDVPVYDEKVAAAAQFQKQRTRWVGVQLYFLRTYFLSGLKALFTGNPDFADKVFQMALVPKLLLTGFLVMAAAAEIFFSGPGLWTWLALGMLAALFLAIPRASYNRQMLAAIAFVPVAFVRLFLAVAGIRKGASGKFEVTEKGQETSSTTSSKD